MPAAQANMLHSHAVGTSSLHRGDSGISHAMVASSLHRGASGNGHAMAASSPLRVGGVRSHGGRDPRTARASEKDTPTAEASTLRGGTVVHVPTAAKITESKAPPTLHPQTIITHGRDRTGAEDTPEDKASVLCGGAEEYVPANQARKDSVAVKAPSGAAAAEDAVAAGLAPRLARAKTSHNYKKCRRSIMNKILEAGMLAATPGATGASARSALYNLSTEGRLRKGLLHDLADAAIEDSITPAVAFKRFHQARLARGL
jgi:hypothetical protein